ncbi:Eco57I restriction-modification methylase domain-containing protein [Mucilaginibacter sp.]|uniref:Eco57I restriction-modification methylase domain-containing protein n=1 Tax=Mucilaginibacter sp. TaxID=1882438 RepID=UPI002606B81B|nr:Eco57I restriction-modification methylase domain-containing protein [Mucilaginibacter sp.]
MSSLETESFEIFPFENELPSAFADRLGIIYASTVTDEHKKKAGQFFTPLPIAKFIGEFAVSTGEIVKILDPGCGIGILSAAMAEDFIFINPQIKTIELVAFETDVKLLPLAEMCFNYLRLWLYSKGVELNYFLCKNDFILHNSHILSGREDIHEKYDLIISNPPYFKLPKDDPRSIAAQTVIYGQTNIYSIFLLIAAKLLKPGGKLIFITPRSFCSGNYFRMFREQFFSQVDIKNIHLFESRSSTFKRDKVLQETLIIAASAKLNSSPNQLHLPFDQISKDSIIISSSSGMSDLDKRTWMFYSAETLIDINSYQKTLHLPSNNEDDKVIDVFRKWDNTLHKFGWEVSTGKIVDFRSQEFILKDPVGNSVPLFWLHNIKYMEYNWPTENGVKGKPKRQYFLSNKDSNKLLVPNLNYVLLRRFSAKDDSRKLIAAPYLSTTLNEFDKIGIENHLNYIYKKQGSLTIEETIGLSALLNSTLFDRYFRTFNGNINVSATELRDIKLPNIKKIIEIGREVLNENEITQTSIDGVISRQLKIKL